MERLFRMEPLPSPAMTGKVIAESSDRYPKKKPVGATSGLLHFKQARSDQGR